MRRTLFVRIAGVIALVCFLPACSVKTRIPASEFSKVEPGKRVVLDVKTPDAHYRVTRFSVTDSTLVIEGIAEGGNTYPSTTHLSVPDSLPYELPLREIASMQRIQEAHPVVDAFGGMTLFVGIIVVALVILISQVNLEAN